MAADLEQYDINSRTPGGTLAYCEYLVSKGYAGPSQVNPWKSALRNVFETVEGSGWESLDLSSVDLSEYLARFQTLAGAKYKAESIVTYGRRVQNAIDAHEHYLAAGRPPSFRKGGSRREKKDDTPKHSGEVVSIDQRERSATTTTPAPAASDLIDFPFPLKNGRMAIMRLPARLSGDDVNRLSGFLRTLQDDAAEQRQIPRQTGESSEAA